MLMLILHWILSSLLLLLVASIVPGIHVANFDTALFAIFVMSLINVFLRPILLLLTLPINLLTLGLFSFVINALLFALASWVVPGFEVSNFWAALLGSFLLAVLTGLVDGFDSNRAAQV